MSRHVAGPVRTAHTRRFVRLRALLAGGLVLGIGGSLTLAAWTDSEFGQATFTASVFNTQSSVDLGTTWIDAITAGSQNFTFNPAGMSPTSTRYAPMWIRTKTGSMDGALALQGATGASGALGTALIYRVVRYTTGTCDVSQFTAGATYIVGAAGTPLAGGVPLTTAAAASTAVAANATPATQLCFEVTMKSDAANTLQGQSVTVNWEVKATSSS